MDFIARFQLGRFIIAQKLFFLSLVSTFLL